MTDSALIGFDDFEKQLKALDLPVQTRVLRRALKKGAATVEQAIEVNAMTQGHIDAGDMIGAIGTKTRVHRKAANKNGADIEALIGVQKPRYSRIRVSGKHGVQQAPPPATVAYWLEHGVEPHFVSESAKRANNRGETVDRQKKKTHASKHPGIPAKPFIEPALREKQGAALNAVATELAASIRRALTK